MFDQQQDLVCSTKSLHTIVLKFVTMDTQHTPTITHRGPATCIVQFGAFVHYIMWLP